VNVKCFEGIAYDVYDCYLLKFFADVCYVPVVAFHEACLLNDVRLTHTELMLIRFLTEACTRYTN